MILIPQIYMKEGNTAKTEGTTSPIFQDDAFATAKNFKDAGAEGLLVVDLSLTPIGKSPNLTTIKRIHDELDLGIYVGGAFKTVSEVEGYIRAGVELVILGSIAYQRPDFLESVCKSFPGKIAAHIDLKGDKVVIPGYAVTTNKTPLDYAQYFVDAGVRYILYSEVDNTGRTTDQCIANMEKFCNEINARVICTSDVSEMSDIEKIVTIEAARLDGLVLAKSIYENRVDLRGAIAMVNDLLLSREKDTTLTEM